MSSEGSTSTGSTDAGYTRMKTAVAIRHVSFEHVGTLAPALLDAGYHLRTIDAADLHEDAQQLAYVDLLIVLGAPIGACDENAYPFLTTELRAIGARLERDRPTLGICLGAQLMARALGARIYPAPDKEIGWKTVSLTPPGCASPLFSLVNTPILHWHGDTFDLPDGAQRLASTEICPNQAFSASSNILALQFHAEVDTKEIEQWLIGHSCEILAAGCDPRDLRRDSLEHGSRLRMAARRAFDAWLRGLC